MPAHIRSVERAARILSALSGSGQMGLTEISREVVLGKSTTHRLLASLIDARLVRTDAASRQYALGYGLLQLTADWLNGLEIRTLSLPHLRDLRHETGETVSLNVRDVDQRVAIERLDTPREIRYVIDLGRPLALHIGAGGKAILAFLPETEIRNLLDSTDLGPRKIQGLIMELKEIRSIGWAVTTGERLPGACAVSAPVFEHEAAAVASVSILCLESTFRAPAAKDFGCLVQATALGVSRDLGWSESRGRGGRESDPGVREKA